MKRALTALMALGLVLGSCSDDSTPADAALQPDSAVADAAIEAAADGMPDCCASDAGDAAADEAGLDAAADVTAGDTTPGDSTPADAALPDGPAGDLGAPSIWGYVSRTAVPALDGKGTLYVSLHNLLLPPPAFPVASDIIKKADLSKVGNKIKFEIFNAPVGGHNLYAFLDDNDNANAMMVAPDTVDLTVAKPIKVTIATGTTVKQDLVLSNLVGGDGGVSTLSGLKGTVKASVTPSGDGKGTLYIFLHTKPPPSTSVASTPHNYADLSSPYATEQYFISGVPAGQYYISAFLDDNNNANFIFPGADKGDMIMSTGTQVHVFAGTINVHNIVLDKIK